MNITQICYFYNPVIGGVESHVENLSRMLVQSGHNVNVICSDYTNAKLTSRIEKEQEIIDNIKVIRLKAKKMATFIPYAQKIKFNGLKQLLLNLKSDVLHCHSVPADHIIVAAKYARRYSIPLFITGHYSPNDLDQIFKGEIAWPYWHFFVRQVINNADQYIAIVESEKERLIKYLGIDPQKITVVPNGICLKEFDRVGQESVEAFKCKYGLVNKKLILFVGRIVKDKGVDLLIQAFQRLAIDNVQLWIVGPKNDASYYQELINLVVAEDFGRSIRFLELERSDVVLAFKACDLFVLPSRGEVFGIVLAEAMYCEKIIIGSNAGGVPEVIDDQETGFLFKNNDPLDLTDKLVTALALSAERRQTIAAAARHKVGVNYDWTKNAARIMGLYQAAIARCKSDYNL